MSHQHQHHRQDHAEGSGRTGDYDPRDVDPSIAVLNVRGGEDRNKAHHDVEDDDGHFDAHHLEDDELDHEDQEHGHDDRGHDDDEDDDRGTSHGPPISSTSSTGRNNKSGRSGSTAGGVKRKKKDEHEVIVDPEAGIASRHPPPPPFDHAIHVGADLVAIFSCFFFSFDTSSSLPYHDWHTTSKSDFGIRRLQLLRGESRGRKKDDTLPPSRESALVLLRRRRHRHPRGER